MFCKTLAFAKEMISDYFGSGILVLKEEIDFFEFPINQHGWTIMAGRNEQ